MHPGCAVIFVISRAVTFHHRRPSRRVTMRRSLGTLGAIIAGAALMIAVETPTAHALTAQQNCFVKMSKAAGKLVKGKLKKIQKCTEKNLKTPGDCTTVNADIAAV